MCTCCAVWGSRNSTCSSWQPMKVSDEPGLPPMIPMLCGQVRMVCSCEMYRGLTYGRAALSAQEILVKFDAHSSGAEACSAASLGTTNCMPTLSMPRVNGKSSMSAEVGTLSALFEASAASSTSATPNDAASVPGLDPSPLMEASSPSAAACAGLRSEPPEAAHISPSGCSEPH